MKHLQISLLLFLLISIGSLYGQHKITYEIHPGAKYTVQELKPAIDMCDMTKYRKETETVRLLFDDDTIVELFSANELMAKGIEVEMDFVNQSEMISVNVFQLHPDGYLIERADNISKEETILRLKKLQK